LKDLLAALLDQVGGYLGKVLGDALAVELAAEKAQERRLDIELPQAMPPWSHAICPGLALPSRGDEADNLLADFARDELAAGQDDGIERLLAVHAREAHAVAPD
jgi:hypothetical protein